jgi:hypothetical protein
MNSTYRKRSTLPTVCALTALLFLSCSLAPFGGGTEGGNVGGVFINDDGSASAKVSVLLIPSDYNPGAVHQNNPVVTSVTASDGSYSFDHAPQGNFSIEAIDSASGRQSLVIGVTVSGSDIRIPLDTLRIPGAVKVFLPLTADPAKGYVYVPGTTAYAPLAGENGYAVVTGLPSKTLPTICYATLSDPTPIVLRHNVHVVSGDTAVVANTEWKYARRLRLNTTATGAGVTRNVTGFPLIVRLTADNFNFSQPKADGSDIRFARSDTVRLPYEIERWDAANRRAEIWVRVDTIYGDNNAQSVTMYWGNATAADSSNGAAVFDTTNGFIGVWHMNEVPSAGTASIKDRTVNAHNATPFGSMTVSNSIDGTIGKALAFNGKTNYLNAGNISVPGNYSIGLWVLLDTLGDYQRFIFKDSSYTLWYDKDSVSVRVEHLSATTWWRGLLQDGGTRVPMTKGIWYYFTGTFEGTAVRLDANGIESSRSNPISVVPRTNAKPVLFGQSANNSFVNGLMDEIRIEGVARPAEWIRLCYMNQRVDDMLVGY